MRLFIIALAALTAFTAAAQRRKAAPQPVPAEVAAQVENALHAYDIALADEQLQQYEGLRGADEAVADQLRQRLETLRSMMDRVQRIAVIDSFTVDKPSFFRVYNLNPASGSISDRSALPSDDFPASATTTVYSTENHDRMLWAAPTDTAGGSRIVESTLLADGSWEQPHTLDDNVNIPGAARVAFPYVMADGVTLYFAADDPATSLGGLDIYMTRFDGQRYLEPQNIGMPFNSEADDYLLVIDETTGAGWWATERNAPEGKTTVYVFVPEETRRNYPSDTPDLAGLALLRSIADTQNPDTDYSPLRQRIRSAQSVAQKKVAEFEISLPNGRILHRLDDLSSEASRYAMEDYLDKADELAALQADLADLRTAYGQGDTTVGPAILRAEQLLPSLRADVGRLLNIAIETELRDAAK